LAALSLVPALLLCSSGCIGQQGLQLEKIGLPEGFKIEVYADNVEDARSMTLSPNGTLFVGSRSAGNVYAVLDKDGNGKADEVITIASGLSQPNGVAFRNGDLYSRGNRILRYNNIEVYLRDPPQPVVVKDDLPAIEAITGSSYALVLTACSMCLLVLPATFAIQETLMLQSHA
jgi:hypothetical protein